ncbi:MAG: rRNA maturation RNase YbeY [Spirochaetota bacterium]
MSDGEKPSAHSIDISADEDTDIPADEGLLRRFICAVLDDPAVSAQGWEISLSFCSESRMSALNTEYRHKSGTTDVLTFVWNERSPEDHSWPDTVFDTQHRTGVVDSRYAGDIAVDFGQVSRNAAMFGVTKEEELRRVLVHGVLHLAGMDHETNEVSEPMLVTQEEILTRLSELRLF